MFYDWFGEKMMQKQMMKSLEISQLEFDACSKMVFENELAHNKTLPVSPLECFS